MFRFLWLSLIFPLALCSQMGMCKNIFSERSEMIATKDGEIIHFENKDKDKFDKLLCKTLENSRDMPALGVALHKETIEDMKSGVWVRFIYGKTLERDGMPYDELVISLEKDGYGLNIIRGNGGVYDGRCFYLDLENSTSELYDFVTSLNVEKKENKEKKNIVINQNPINFLIEL